MAGKPQTGKPDGMKLLTRVLLVGYIDINSLRQHMALKTTNVDVEHFGDGILANSSVLDYFTYVVDFHNHKVAVEEARNCGYQIQGVPVFVFLYDEKEKKVYSRQDQTVSWPDGVCKEVVQIPPLDPLVPTTVLLPGVPIGNTADEIKRRMEELKCPVKDPVQYVKPLHIAIVEFERSEDAVRVANMGTVKVPHPYAPKRVVPSKTQDGVLVYKPLEETGRAPELHVPVFVLLPLPSESS